MTTQEEYVAIAMRENGRTTIMSDIRILKEDA